jgi:hypothetical protein
VLTRIQFAPIYFPQNNPTLKQLTWDHSLAGRLAMSDSSLDALERATSDDAALLMHWRQRRIDVDGMLEWMCQDNETVLLCRDIVGIVFAYCFSESVSRHEFRAAAAACKIEQQ